MLKWILGFVLFGYLTGLVGLGVVHYFDYPEQGMQGAIEHGALWPSAFLRMMR